MIRLIQLLIFKIISQIYNNHSNYVLEKYTIQLLCHKSAFYFKTAKSRK